jgi:hypothetical protein
MDLPEDGTPEPQWVESGLKHDFTQIDRDKPTK